MAIGKASDFVIYDEQYHSGQVEVLAQNLNAFNAASQNCLVQRSRQLPGDYEKSSFFPMTSGLVNHRDTTVVTSVADTALTQSEDVNVKTARRLGPVAQTLDAWRKLGSTPQQMSFVFGRQAGTAKIQNAINAGIRSLVAAIKGIAAYHYDGSAGTMTHAAINNGIKAMGDRGQEVACLVMHSKPWYDLVGQAISDKVYGVANTVIYGGSPGTLGKPVVVIDDTSLVNTTSTGTTYYTLGLVAGACLVDEVESETLVSETVTGLENLVGRVQGEYAIMVGLKGYAWDTASGGKNPNDAALAVTANWDQIATDNKDTAGIIVETQ